MPESVTQDDIRECILESLAVSGRADYENNAICEWSEVWMEANPDSDDDYGESPVVIIWIDWSNHPDYKLSESI